MSSATIRTLAFLITAIGIAACSTNRGAPEPATGVCSDEPVARAQVTEPLAEVAEPPAEVVQQPVAPAHEPLAECGVSGAAAVER